MSPGRRGLGVRARLCALASGAALVAVVIGGAFLYRSVTATLSGALTEELRSHAQDVAAELAVGATPSLDTGVETQVLGPDVDDVAPGSEQPLLDVAERARAAEGGLVVDRTASGRHLRIVAVPATTSGGGQVVVVAGSTATIDATEQRLLGRLLLAGGVLVAFTAAAAWVVTRGALRPVRSMSRRARSLSTQDPDERLPVPPGQDEVAELGVTLNQMLDRIAEARARERTFIDDASHELRAPLAVVRGELELALLEHPADLSDDVRRVVANALDETDRLVRLSDQLLVLARADAGMLAVEGASSSLAEVVHRGVGRAGSHDVQVVVDDADTSVAIDEVALEQVVTNLVANAARWATSAVRCECLSEGGRMALVRVSDDGPGFAPSYLAHAFERFRRADAVRSRAGASNGLGLAIVAAIVQAHGGQIALGNGAAGGAWVEVRLPVAEPLPQARMRVPAGS